MHRLQIQAFVFQVACWGLEPAAIDGKCPPAAINGKCPLSPSVRHVVRLVVVVRPLSVRPSVPSSAEFLLT